jgi:glycosyltransferase involved in cell wall biosynthesis
LSRWIDEEQLRDRFYLLGHREDVRRIIAGSVVVASSSGGEAFPMVLGEAMAAGVPCVATDTGDVRLLIGDAGIVVPAQDAKGLAEGMLTMLDMPEELRTEMGLRAREHIQRHFALPDIVARYQDVYLSVSDMGRRYQDVGASSRHGRRAL